MLFIYLFIYFYVKKKKSYNNHRLQKKVITRNRPIYIVIKCAFSLVHSICVDQFPLLHIYLGLHHEKANRTTDLRSAR